MPKKPITKAQQLIAERRVARKLALFSIYQWQMTEHSFEEIYLQLQTESELAADLRKSDRAFLMSLAQCAIKNEHNIEQKIEPYLDHRNLHQVDMIEQAVLRLATCELLNHIETPYKVVVNEAINLSKKFGGEQGHRFVNGVLKGVVAEIRALELQSEEKTSPNKPATD